jgi:hypothetical protein
MEALMEIYIKTELLAYVLNCKRRIFPKVTLAKSAGIVLTMLYTWIQQLDGCK